jgi:hypothetical protein
MSLDPPSRATFGQRGAATPPPAPIPMPAAQALPTLRTSRAPKSSRTPLLLLLAAWELCLVILAAVVVSWAGGRRTAIAAEGAQAAQRVVAIVNQPVTHLPRTPAATVFSPGWFHPGATRPDFAHVDVRQSQELIYDKDTYVTSDLNPSEMFLGGELEFNAMTKVFYVDRNLPKKRLSEDEMLEVNRLYRAIAHSDQAMATWRAATATLALLGLALAAAPLLVARRRLGAAD